LTLECKCHGVSGSCSVRTCWRGLGASGPSAAGSRLLRRYATAAEVRPRSGGRLPPLYHHDNLLYTIKSPDYCLPDKKRGSLGTIGRSDAPLNVQIILNTVSYRAVMSHFPVRPVSYLSRLLLVSFDILSIPLEIIEIELRRVRART